MNLNSINGSYRNTIVQTFYALRRRYNSKKTIFINVTWTICVICLSSFFYGSVHCRRSNSRRKLFNYMLSMIGPYHSIFLIFTWFTCTRSLVIQVVIFDESHFLKNYKSQRTKVALEMSANARRIILLSGTPALSRPIELYPQIQCLAVRNWPAVHDFALRYVSRTFYFIIQ